MKQLDLFSYKEILEIPEIKKNEHIFLKQSTSQKVENVLNGKFNYKFKDLYYDCYEIEIKDNIINKIKFKVGRYKFLIYIKYEILKEIISQINYNETDKEDREKFFENINIKNIQILSIQKKVKVGYSESKNNVNYFRYLGIDYFYLKSFLEKLITKFNNKLN